MRREPSSAHFSESVTIAAEPAAVYRLLADIPAMGRRSPECWYCSWIDGDHAVPGARFRGWNWRLLLIWSTVCEIEVADGRELTFRVIQGAAGRRTRWRYTVEPAPGGTSVREECEVPSAGRFFLVTILLRVLSGTASPAVRITGGMRRTLRILKQEAEAATDLSLLAE
jgi:hypothetical protein